MCSYREKKPDPTEMMQLDGFTVDYCEQVPGLSPFSLTLPSERQRWSLSLCLTCLLSVVFCLNLCMFNKAEKFV